jgi:hypothetical protein
MNDQQKQPHSLPRLAPTDEHKISLVTRGSALALANLLFYLSSPASPGTDRPQSPQQTPKPSETAPG